MSSENFRCITHEVPGQHIRHYPRGTSISQEAVVRVQVKQYTPIDVYDEDPNKDGAITILACHASAFLKELYEPIWDALLQHSRSSKSFRIRNVWMADVSTQNASGVLNEKLIGNEHVLVKHLGLTMRAIFSLSHCNLALLHPRLLSGIFAVDPILNNGPSGMSFVGVYGVTFKKDRWPSRKAAEEFIRNNPFYKHWNPRTLDLFLQYGLRELPTLAHPLAEPLSLGDEVPITFKTTKDQEALSFAKAAYLKFGQPQSSFRPTHERHPDIGTGAERNEEHSFYRPEANMTHLALPRLRPSSYFLYASKSHMSSANEQGRAVKRAITGKGNDGSGGVACGQFADSVITGSHFVPFERPEAVAKEAGQWLDIEVSRWMKEEEIERSQWEAVPLPKRAQLEEDWKKWAKALYGHKDAKNTSSPKAKI